MLKAAGGEGRVNWESMKTRTIRAAMVRHRLMIRDFEATRLRKPPRPLPTELFNTIIEKG